MQGIDTPGGALATVVIAVHTAQRPLSRAIESCLSPSLAGKVKVLVVCHNIDMAAIKANVALPSDADISYLQLDDGLSSPAGPKNMGLAHCSTPYVLVLDSDDYLEPGALAQWLELLVSSKVDGVIAPLKRQGGGVIRTPRARLLRGSSLDPVKDQLAYATAPRGLWSMELLESIGFRYTPGLRTAEDLDAGLRLWFSGAKLEFPWQGPHYVLGEDALDRVTADVLPLAEEFRAVLALDQAWLSSLSASQRQSIAAKLLRIHLLGALLRRGPGGDWPEPDRRAVHQFVVRATEISPTVEKSLTVAESTLVARLSDSRADGDALRRALREYIDAGYGAKLFNRRLLANLRPDSVVRHQLRLKIHTVLDRMTMFRAKA
ncbi:glycosyltransferase family A protein [Arthrobacter sp. HY1533]|uniref:glycosyltransferase family A protein n=1 Tax=Arthrobacter sp. HY1533 TaxID=2970919 RepID=UPI0022B9F465|nr:glycosyltransferase family 2 protein [Arthrobacter sp. HY1533]